MPDDLSDNARWTGRLAVERVRRPDHSLLRELEAYDFEAFGPTGLRTYDLAVMAEAGAVYVARLGGDIVGGCQLIRVLDEPTFFYVVGFYVRPAWKRKGIGRGLLSRVAEESRRCGADGLVLTVSPENTPALALYERAGFVNERFVRHFYGEGEDRYILRWSFGSEVPGSTEPLQGSV